MQRAAAIILCLYILFSALVPCAYIDRCKEDTCSDTSAAAPGKGDCANCSPFSTCCGSMGFTINTIDPVIVPGEDHNMVVYHEYRCAFSSAYTSAFFQPPRPGCIDS